MHIFGSVTTSTHHRLTITAKPFVRSNVQHNIPFRCSWIAGSCIRRFSRSLIPPPPLNWLVGLGVAVNRRKIQNEKEFLAPLHLDDRGPLAPILSTVYALDATVDVPTFPVADAARARHEPDEPANFACTEQERNQWMP